MARSTGVCSGLWTTRVDVDNSPQQPVGRGADVSGCRGGRGRSPAAVLAPATGGGALRRVRARVGLARGAAVVAVVALGGGAGGRAGAAVGAVEPASLEHDPHRREHLAQRAGAGRALLQGGVGEGLHGLEPVVTGGAGVL